MDTIFYLNLKNKKQAKNHLLFDRIFDKRKLPLFYFKTTFLISTLLSDCILKRYMPLL